MSMDAPQRTRRVNRDRSGQPWQAQRGARQIVIPLTREQYEACWHDPVQVRALLDQTMAESPELFPPCLGDGYALHGFARASRKLDGIRLRKIRPRGGGETFHLRPSFVMSYMAGTTDELAYPLLLASFGVPMWVLTLGYGHNEMFWYRHVERLGRNSLVGTTVRDPARLPEHLAADEHHVDWSGEKGYIATTAAEGCLLGIALTKSADDAHLAVAYGDFAAEARDVKLDYVPQSVNTDGWACTQNAFRSLFAGIAVILCFLHGFLKIRERCHKQQNHELHRRVWEVYRAPTVEDFRRLMNELWAWCATQTWTSSVRDMVAKLWKKTGQFTRSLTDYDEVLETFGKRVRQAILEKLVSRSAKLSEIARAGDPVVAASVDDQAMKATRRKFLPENRERRQIEIHRDAVHEQQRKIIFLSLRCEQQTVQPLVIVGFECAKSRVKTHRCSRESAPPARPQLRPRRPRLQLRRLRAPPPLPRKRLPPRLLCRRLCPHGPTRHGFSSMRVTSQSWLAVCS